MHFGRGSSEGAENTKSGEVLEIHFSARVSHCGAETENSERVCAFCAAKNSRLFFKTHHIRAKAEATKPEWPDAISAGTFESPNAVYIS
jgi:hypothetical protein